MRYYLSRDKNGQGDPADWLVYLGTSAEGGTVVLVLPGAVPLAVAEKARRALASARSLGRREVADAVTSQAQSLRLADGDFA